MKANHQAGEIVTVYSDPVTKRKAEGKAKLLKLIQTERGDLTCRWKVKFIHDGFVCERNVAV